VLEWAREQLRDGYDVELAGALRLYVCVERMKTPFIAAKTIGAYRKSVSDKAVKPFRKEEAVTPEKITNMNNARKSEFRHVTPETIVQCPECGARFKVGKCLR